MTPEHTRGSAAKHLLDAINRGDIQRHTTPDNIAMFIAVLLAPIHGQAANLTTRNRRRHHRITLHTEPAKHGGRYGTAGTPETTTQR